MQSEDTYELSTRLASWLFNMRPAYDIAFEFLHNGERIEQVTQRMRLGDRLNLRDDDEEDLVFYAMLDHVKIKKDGDYRVEFKKVELVPYGKIWYKTFSKKDNEWKISGYDLQVRVKSVKKVNAPEMDDALTSLYLAIGIVAAPVTLLILSKLPVTKDLARKFKWTVFRPLLLVSPPAFGVASYVFAKRSYSEHLTGSRLHVQTTSMFKNRPVASTYSEVDRPMKKCEQGEYNKWDYRIPSYVCTPASECVGLGESGEDPDPSGGYDRDCKCTHGQTYINSKEKQGNACMALPGVGAACPAGYQQPSTGMECMRAVLDHHTAHCDANKTPADAPCTEETNRESCVARLDKQGRVCVWKDDDGCQASNAFCIETLSQFLPKYWTHDRNKVFNNEAFSELPLAFDAGEACVYDPKDNKLKATVGLSDGVTPICVSKTLRGEPYDLGGAPAAANAPAAAAAAPAARRRWRRR